jgi:inhibitor of KinA sporulation pathway (predicted exonuclease)
MVRALRDRRQNEFQPQNVSTSQFTVANQMIEENASFLNLSDDDFMLLLCVRPEKLADPSRWCREMRAYAQASIDGPKTSVEADELFAMMERLRDEANGEWLPDDD